MNRADAAEAQRCGTADAHDPTPCEGTRHTVTVVDREGRQHTGCVHHSARLLASLEGARVHPAAAVLPWAVVEVYCRAAELPPYAWQVGR